MYLLPPATVISRSMKTCIHFLHHYLLYIIISALPANGQDASVDKLHVNASKFLSLFVLARYKQRPSQRWGRCLFV